MSFGRGAEQKMIEGQSQSAGGSLTSGSPHLPRSGDVLEEITRLRKSISGEAEAEGGATKLASNSNITTLHRLFERLIDVPPPCSVVMVG